MHGEHAISRPPTPSACPQRRSTFAHHDRPPPTSDAPQLRDLKERLQATGGPGAINTRLGLDWEPRGKRGRSLHDLGVSKRNVIKRKETVRRWKRHWTGTPATGGAGFSHTIPPGHAPATLDSWLEHVGVRATDHRQAKEPLCVLEAGGCASLERERLRHAHAYDGAGRTQTMKWGPTQCISVRTPDVGAHAGARCCGKTNRKRAPVCAALVHYTLTCNAHTVQQRQGTSSERRSSARQALPPTAREPRPNFAAVVPPRAAATTPTNLRNPRRNQQAPHPARNHINEGQGAGSCRSASAVHQGQWCAITTSRTGCTCRGFGNPTRTTSGGKAIGNEKHAPQSGQDHQNDAAPLVVDQTGRAKTSCGSELTWAWTVMGTSQ